MSDGTHLRGVAVAIPSRLQSSVVEVAPVDERIMQVRLKHTLGLMSVIAVYAPTEMCETEKKEMFFAKINSVLDRCHPPGTPSFLGATSMHRESWLRAMCWSPWLWNEEHKQFSSPEFCKIKKIEN